MKEKVIHILEDYIEADKISKEEIGLEDSLTADLGLSSLDVIDVVLAFEEEFGIEIPDEDIMGFATVGDIVRYLESN